MFSRALRIACSISTTCLCYALVILQIYSVIYANRLTPKFTLAVLVTFLESKNGTLLAKNQKKLETEGRGAAPGDLPQTAVHRKVPYLLFSLYFLTFFSLNAQGFMGWSFSASHEKLLQSCIIYFGFRKLFLILNLNFLFVNFIVLVLLISLLSA